MRKYDVNRVSGNLFYLFFAEEAQILGLVDEVTVPKELIKTASKKASDLSIKPASAFASIKSLLRKSVLDEIHLREK